MSVTLARKFRITGEIACTSVLVTTILYLEVKSGIWISNTSIISESIRDSIHRLFLIKILKSLHRYFKRGRYLLEQGSINSFLLLQQRNLLLVPVIAQVSGKDRRGRSLPGTRWLLLNFLIIQTVTTGPTGRTG